jgi:DNA polymerase III alpha subunit
MAVVKQRPYTAKGILFVSLEDEWGLLDLIIKPSVYERYRPLIRHQTFLSVEGVVQKASGAVSVLVTRAMEWRVLQNQRPTG